MATLAQTMLMKNAENAGQVNPVADAVSGAKVGMELYQMQQQLEIQKQQQEENKIKLLKGQADFLDTGIRKALFAPSDKVADAMLKRLKVQAADMNINLDDGWAVDFKERRQELRKSYTDAMDVIKNLPPGSEGWKLLMSKYIGSFGNPDTTELRQGISEVMQYKSKSEIAAAQAIAAQARASTAESKGKEAKANVELIGAKTATQEKLGKKYESQTAHEDVKKELTTEQVKLAAQKFGLEERSMSLKEDKDAFDRYAKQKALDLQKERLELDRWKKEQDVKIAEGKAAENFKSKLHSYQTTPTKAPMQYKNTLLVESKIAGTMDKIKEAKKTNNVQMYNKAIKELIAIDEKGRISDYDFELMAANPGLSNFINNANYKWVGNVPEESADNIIALLERMQKNNLRDRAAWKSVVVDHSKMLSTFKGAWSEDKIIGTLLGGKGKEKAPGKTVVVGEATTKRIQELIDTRGVSKQEVKSMLGRELTPEEDALFGKEEGN